MFAEASPPLWSPTLERALRWAATGHDGQRRKGSPVPYIEHPMAVAMILDRAGFPEEVVVAGLLHDLVEDTDATIEEVADRFGPVVAEVVAACSEVKRDASGAKRPWADRKRDHLAALVDASVETRAVILADKRHNLACIALDLEDGRPVWPAFNADRADVLAYYRAAIVLCRAGDPRLDRLAGEADALLRRIEAAGKIPGRGAGEA